MKANIGFTLLELIIVILILGILAAYAVPKFFNIEREARTSAVTGILKSVQSASNLVHALAIVKNKTSSSAYSLDIGAGDVIVSWGYPVATYDGIGAALSEIGDLELVNGVNNEAQILTFQHPGAQTPAKCAFIYSRSSAGYSPTIEKVSNFDCS